MSAASQLRFILLAKAGAGVALGAGFGAAFWLQANGLTLGDLKSEMTAGGEPRFAWTSIDKKHWQPASPNGEGEAPEVTDAREGTSAGCRTGMVRVRGNYRLETLGTDVNGEIERIQDAACTDWISKDFPARCRTFDGAKIARDLEKLPTKPLDFCMDRFEYPNVLGQNPMIVVTFREAEALCKKDQKRLCTESEWTFACEGEEARPYPYGWTRDATACVVDRSWRPFSEGALSPRDGDKAREELDRLWQAEPSGSRGACRSPFGVYDMTGNVDEWTRTVRSTGYASILKGGYWGPVRARCRPSTRAHNEDFVAYQQSFRCCAESTASVPAPPPVPPVARADAGAEEPSAPPPPPPKDEEVRPDAGSRPTSADLQPGWDGQEGDELDALRRRARVGLGCSASPGAWSPATLGLAMGAAFACAARRRRR